MRSTNTESKAVMDQTILQVSDAIALINQTLDYAYPSIVVEGEVASFKVNQNKFVFFDIKDESATLGCFMMVFALRVPIEDGMRVRVVAQPKLTQWGKFSLTVRDVQPVGEGSLKRAFALLHAKLDKEGLFAAERKRTLPRIPSRVGVISSVQAAGYADFIKILNSRWGGVAVDVANVTVQGASAPQQIVRALTHFNEQAELVDVIVIIRGGGSLDDLSAFNDEPLVRAIASSRIPVMTGIGHEVDTSLADLAADVRAATPSNAAQLLVPDRTEMMAIVDRDVVRMIRRYEDRLSRYRRDVTDATQLMARRLDQRFETMKQRTMQLAALLRQLDPSVVLARGYSLLRDTSGRIVTGVAAGDAVKIETQQMIIDAEVTHVHNK
ncbi:MAG: exodeoxyribonuclease VII large subunit [Candidatus Saccharimonadales bacterium]|jgi:exodeoxyribonuclease VII large subunit